MEGNSEGARLTNEASQYRRTAFDGVLMRNDRVNMVNKLMAKTQKVYKYIDKA
jgi:hypothetical protein